MRSRMSSQLRQVSQRVGPVAVWANAVFGLVFEHLGQTFIPDGGR
jgi:hypothetical protein